MRPAQWVKNLLVFAAPGAAGVLDATSSWSVVSRVFIGFCAVSSALYLVNDVVDRAEDRAHPMKRLRPIASGAVSVPLALAASAVLAAAGLALVAWVGGGVTLLTVGVYVAVTL
ncbi:MAG: UbiA family prenyltransferase, partial [Actinomycetota bacterium]|nr:UbiA family prenyltransferase [Actinomycetota bacterium]